MLEILRKKFENYKETCSITDLKDGCVSFIRDKNYLHYIRKNVDAWIIAPKELKNEFGMLQLSYSPKIKGIFIDHNEYYFCLYHNMLYKDRSKTPPKIGKNCKIHPTVIMDVDGLKVVNAPNGEKIPFIHTGCVEIGDNVEIGPYTVIHRATMQKTKISSGCKMGALNNIAHNCCIGKNNIIAAGVVFNGGVKTGENCWIGSNSVFRQRVYIPKDSIIGMGSVVTKTLEKTGIYAGNPARFIKPITKGWNF